MALIATIDEYACAAHGDCVVTAPDVFAMEDIAVVVGTGPDELMIAAARSCPSTAITLVDSATGRQVYP
jgi:ferredoxin